MKKVDMLFSCLLLVYQFTLRGAVFFIAFSGIGLKRRFRCDKMAVSKGFCWDKFIQWTTKEHYCE